MIGHVFAPVVNGTWGMDIEDSDIDSAAGVLFLLGTIAMGLFMFSSLAVGLVATTLWLKLGKVSPQQLFVTAIAFVLASALSLFITGAAFCGLILKIFS